MPWMLLVLTVAASVATTAGAPAPTRSAAAPAAPAACPAVVAARVEPPRPFRPGSVAAVPIPTRVDARPCPIPLAGVPQPAPER